MALRQILDSTGSTQEDLPWVNEYVQFIGEVNDSFPVTKVVQTAKGYLVLTDHFKGFLFQNSAIYSFLTEALTVWITNESVNSPLFAIANSQGKISLAIDDELEPSIWIYDKKKTWEQKIKKTQGSGYTTQESNPLLSLKSSPTSSGKRKKSTDTPSPLPTSY